MSAAAKRDCLICGESVAVLINKSGQAYYSCGHCGVHVVCRGVSRQAHDYMIHNFAKHGDLPQIAANPEPKKFKMTGVL